MDISVVIVNYNVKYFLEQCLQSVRLASEGLATEVIVVDNNSSDNSSEMVQEKFPEVLYIANKENVGFSRANNQAIRIAKGRYVLLLNPDTIVEKDTFQKCIAFIDQHSDCGGLGVKMINGAGVFLPESKRGLPTPSVAFYKIFGLSTLFPKSKKFGRYTLSYLNNDETNEVEILAGAFMMLRKATLDKIGLLDEDFFMYGEDIDLSYRIILGGYKNFYFPETRIIHYKGESTKKSSVNYVFVFYRAMIIFCKKHFQNNWKILRFFINIAVYLRALFAIFNRILKTIFVKPFQWLFCNNKNRRIAIIGNRQESERISNLLKTLQLQPNLIKTISYQENKNQPINHSLENIQNIKEIVKKHKINEIIFCGADISTDKIIDYMIELQKFKLEYKIAPAQSDFIIGSNSIDV